MQEDQKKTIFVFGNSELPADSLPLKILPELKRIFPEIDFQVKDPNEDWNIPEELTIIDTVQRIKDVAIFKDLDNFEKAPRLTMHDFDAYANLLLLKKLGKLKKIKIIGIPAPPSGGPPMISKKEAVEKISAILRAS